MNLRRFSNKSIGIIRFVDGKLVRFFGYFRVAYLSAGYFFHLWIRYLHDRTYQTNDLYKKYSDKRYTSHVHKTVLATFIVSFVVFIMAQSLFPELFDISKTKTTQASSTTQTWTTRGDFNNSTTKTNNPVISGAQDSDDANVTLSSDFSWSRQTSTANANSTGFHTAVWTGSEMVVWGGIAGGNSGGRYNPETDTWVQLSTTNGPGGRSHHTAVWTGSKMIVWGGLGPSQTGGVWSPLGTDGCSDPGGCWIPTSLVNAPEARYYHSAIWTGAEMIIWGGTGSTYMNSGGAYNPTTNTWRTISAINAPTARYSHAAVWTGSKMIVWGGYNIQTLNSGHIYDPATDTWSTVTVSTSGAPAARQLPFIVWTGSKMIVWGGALGGGEDSATNTGGLWTPDGTEGCDSPGGCWSATTQTNVPSPRFTYYNNVRTVWTGSKMIVWGGGNKVNTGGVYDPVLNTWTATSTTNAPAGRVYHSAVWTGSKMIIYGGLTSNYTNTGAIFSNIYQSPAAISNFKIDSLANQKSKWATISWNGNTPTNTGIKFRTRGSNMETPLSMTGNAETGWTYWNNDAGGTNYNTSSGSSIVTTSTRWLEVELTLTSSDGAYTPTLNDFTVTYDTLESPVNSNTTLYKSDGTTRLKTSAGAVLSGGNGAGYTNETSLKVTATDLSCNDCPTSTGRKIEVEAKVLGSAFTGTGTVQGDSVDAGGGNYTSTATLTGLTAGASYHLQMRTIDSEGRVSAWTSYGNNAEDAADLTIDQTAPTVSTTGWKTKTDTNINQVSGTYYAPSRDIKLSIDASDSGGSNLSYAQLSNDGTTWGAVTVTDGPDNTPNTADDVYAFTQDGTYALTGASQATDLPWQLTDGDAAKTVYVRVRDNGGNIAKQLSDTNFGGTFSNSLKINNSIILGPKPTDGDSSDGYAGNGMTPFVDTGSATGDIVDSSMATSRVYMRFSLPTSSVLSAIFYYDIVNNQNDNSGVYVCGINDYGSLTPDYFQACVTGTVNLNNAGVAGWHSTDITSIVNTFIDQGKTVIGLQLFTSPGNDSVYLYLYESGTNKPYVMFSPNNKYLLSGTYNSSVIDSGMLDPSYGQFKVVESKLSSTNITYQIRGGSTANPDGGWTGFTNVSNGDTVPQAVQGKRYLQYQASFSTPDETRTPVLDDLFIEVLNSVSASIILDTAPPTSPQNLAAYTDSGMTSQYDPSNWYTATNPFFAWDTAGQDIDHFEYCLQSTTNLNCTPATNLNSINYYQSDLSGQNDGIKTFKVVAVDKALNRSTVSSVVYQMDRSIPDPISNFRVHNFDDRQIELRWDAFLDSGSPLEHYHLERMEYQAYLALTPENKVGDWSQLPENERDGYAQKYPTQNSYIDYTDAQTDPIRASVRYIYRIRVKDITNSQYSSYQSNEVTGFTQDLEEPSDVQGVLAVSTSGFSNTVSWNESVDEGAGVELYEVWRADESASIEDFRKVGEATSPIFYDNDAYHIANNSTQFQLNDYTQYFYRIIAVDFEGNKTPLLPSNPMINNSAYTQTPDVTPPSNPVIDSVAAMGLDSSRTKQKLRVSWGLATDKKARSNDDGTGVKEYILYRSLTQNQNDFQEIARINHPTNTYSDEGLEDFTTYYYQLLAIDKASPANQTDYSSIVGKRTATSQIPTTPNPVNVTSEKGDPNVQGSEVGSLVKINFTGSYSKNYQVTKYEVYRSQEALSGDDWLDPQRATKLKFSSTTCPQGFDSCFTVNPSGSEIDITPVGNDTKKYYIYDRGLDDAAAYYYSVRALDNTPAPENAPCTDDLKNIQCSFYSMLSEPQTQSPGEGWDITPDSTEPTFDSLGLDVRVRDTHPDDQNLRNIITWRMLSGTNIPTREKMAWENCTVVKTVSGVNYCSDYWRYEVYREKLNPLNDEIISTTSIFNTTSINENLYIDEIPLVNAFDKYKYYVVVADGAGNSFRYENGTYINQNYPNISEKQYAPDSIIPGKATPVVEGNVTLTSVEVSSAVVNWTTDQEADSLVQYREYIAGNNNSDWITIGKIERSISHSVKIFDLLPDKQYEYKLVSRNYLGNSVDNSLLTLPVLRTSAFGFSTLPSTEITTTSVKVNWETTTGIISNSNYVEWVIEGGKFAGQSGVAGQLADSGNAYNFSDHEVVIKGLKSSTNYRFRVISISNDGYRIAYPDTSDTNAWLKFTTRGYDTAQFVVAPNSSNIAEQNISASSAQIVWNTSIPTTSWVYFGTSRDNMNMSAGDNSLNTSHAVKLENLQSGVTYYYYVQGQDDSGQTFTSQISTFRAIAKPKVQNVRTENVSSYSVILAWETNVETETMVNWGTSTTYGSRIGKPEKTRNHVLEIENLFDDTLYHYQIVARDEYGNEVTTSDYTVRTPIDKEGPKIEKVKTDIMPMGENDTTAQVIVSFTTNKPSTTKVEYDLGVIGGNYSKSSTEDNSLNTSHTVIIKGLDPSATYHYRIVTKDKRGNQTISNDYTFVTPTKEKSIWQLIVKSLEETFAWTKNLGSLFRRKGK